MDKNRKRGLRRAINKHNTRAYSRDHSPLTHRAGYYFSPCWRNDDHPHRSKDCRGCKMTRYYCNSNEAALDAGYKDYCEGNA